MNRYRTRTYIWLFAAYLTSCVNVLGETTNTVIRQNVAADATRDFRFRFVPSPASDDLATDATFTLVSGQRDGNGGQIQQLHDGKWPSSADEPPRNFFLRAGTEGGRILIDLGQTSSIDQINTYSWHPQSRGPQVYTLYGARESSEFDVASATQNDLDSAGWSKLAVVDTRPEQGEVGGQYGVSLFSKRGSLGKFRYLLFDVSCTEQDDPFGNTFYSEIDVIGSPVDAEQESDPSKLVYEFVIDDGGYEVTIDTTATPDLTEWANTKLAPVVKEWYPKIVQLFPSEGFEPPQSFSITFNETDRGVASCSGTRINCSSGWFRRNLRGEALGSVVHEMVHVVQQYRGRRRGGRRNPNAMRTPFWLQEGIPDFVRWFLYEPQSRGAEINPRNVENARYDSGYRVSANFLNWVANRHGFEIISRINGQLREREYTGEIWETTTGHSVEELGAMWKTAMEKAMADGPAALREQNQPFVLPTPELPTD